MIKLKIIIGGAKDTGKTSLINRYVTGKFNINSQSTIGVDFLTKNVSVGSQQVHLTLWDFGGEKRFRVLFPAYCSGASGALLLYDVTSRISFTDLGDWLDLIEKNSQNVIKLLIGSKIDLNEHRQVSKEEAIEFQKNHHIENYLECSAKTGENVDKIFQVLSKSILETNLRECPHCAEMIPKDLIFCQYCGKKLI
jgi:small GTP-binding protein